MSERADIAVTNRHLPLPTPRPASPEANTQRPEETSQPTPATPPASVQRRQEAELRRRIEVGWDAY